jgi:general stress protein 26
MKQTDEIKQILKERFGHDTVLSVSTMDGDRPNVRMVNAYYEDGAFYTITYALSGKMQQIAKNPTVAVCGEWFTAHGTASNLGYILSPSNTEIMEKLRKAFADWYDNGHTDESDSNTCILQIKLTDGLLLNHGTRYDIDFT